MLHDETLYPDPLAFKPERWLERDAKTRDGNVFPLEVVFGFGRRCVDLLSPSALIKPLGRRHGALGSLQSHLWDTALTYSYSNAS